MKKIKNKYFVLSVLSLTLMFASCNDYEDTPVDVTSIDYVFDRGDSLGLRSYGYLADMYRLIYDGNKRFRSNGLWTQANNLESATDNAISADINNNSAIMRLAIGNYSAANGIQEDMTQIWSDAYFVIRKANVFIANIDAVPLLSRFTNDKGEVCPMNKAWKAEARFLRALFYFELVKRFGGIPLMGDHIANLGDDLELPRNSFEECVEYIVSEMDMIKDSLRVLPVESPDIYGFVATKNAALALKSRILLYAASPLFNGNPIEPNNELIGYTKIDEESKKQRWERAAKAAKDFMEAFGEGYGGKGTHALAPDFLNIFLADYSAANPEVIFVREGGRNTEVERIFGPIGFADPNSLGEGMTCPTQNLVDAFPMLDGTSRETSTAYNDSRMYTERDPRLNYTVLHNGSPWLQIVLATYDGGPNNPSGATKKTKTSYYQRKFMQKAEYSDRYNAVNHRWIMFRYAEILFNFIEAENELDGPTTEIYDILKAIRRRAGISAGRALNYGVVSGMSQNEMRELIRNERRIELAFEEHRFWDIRRWRIAEEIYSKPLQGLSITREGQMYVYNRINVLNVKFESKMNLYPIPYSEVIKNRNLKQNPGW